MEAVARLSRGAITVARRRGIGYFKYLLAGVVWPKATYWLAWGPTAPAFLQRAFAALGRSTASSSMSADELRHLGLLAEGGTPIPASAVAAPEIEALMERAHALGITGVAQSFRDLVRDPAGAVRFGQLAGARRYRPQSLYFCAARDADRRAFNREFGTTLLTEASARDGLRTVKAKVPEGYRDYAPIDFGSGLTVGAIASTDSGTGRWDFFNRDIVAPIVAGKRVLDLGSNNGSMPLMMLRAGARAIVGIEYTPEIADFARLNARILSWRDMRAYDIQILTGDMRQFLTGNLGSFDVVTAFCSLYYLPEEEMARVVARAASMRAALVLQANDAITNLPASTEDLERLMLANGYKTVRVFRAPQFSRPLLVGSAG